MAVRANTVYLLLILALVATVSAASASPTSLTIGEHLVNRPSDTTGERPVGAAVVLLP